MNETTPAEIGIGYPGEITGNGTEANGGTTRILLSWMRRRSIQLRGEIDQMQHEAVQIRQRLETLAVGVEQRRGAIAELERMLADEMEKDDSGE